ncbi:TPA: NAD(P)-binding protein [Citrobacter freundii]
MPIFSSFWQAGFEGADFVTRQGNALSMNNATAHDSRHAGDYEALAPFRILTVRESIGWRLIDKPGGYDFSTVAAKMISARAKGIQICWTICHYGWPDDIDFFSGEFIRRFARLCGALAAFLRPWYREPPVYSPVNEISFTAWGISEGMFTTVPSGEGNSLESKRQLVRATLAASDAIWAADPRARILHCDPLIHLVSSDESAAAQQEAEALRTAQFQAWDMLAGLHEPELGGAPRYLDIIGANYYHDNQWQTGDNQRLFWHLGDHRRRRLHDMLRELYERYRRPLLLAETSHVGSGRGAWINDVVSEAIQAQLAGVELLGICLYPIIDRPDWENSAFWHRSGLWEIYPENDDPFNRHLDAVYAQALLQSQTRLEQFQKSSGLIPCLSRERSTMKKIYVFSHLRWDFVFQRPQHLMTRLAQHYRIIFIEEPVFSTEKPELKRTHPAPNVTVIQPHTPSTAPGFHDGQIAYLEALLTELKEPDETSLAWFYTPMALPLLKVFTPAVVVYDCMDELAAFDKAPRQLLQRESALLTRADLVFTGGPSLYEARKGRHANIHCFSSSVDAIHFEQARDRANHHPLQNAIPHPRLGYCGVIDERVDVSLIATLADTHPQWQIVMVGPVVKIDPATLPKRENIHYLGMQPYQALPQFLAGWDVCLMPFALNESTRFISPTKVLEYMAAELPVVSTAITDVEKPYAHVVAIAHDHAAFLRACEEALTLSPEARRAQQQMMQEIVANTSWDKTVQRMYELIEKEFSLSLEAAALPDSSADAGTEDVASPAVLRLAPPDAARASSEECLILGAGPTGLSAAYHYGEGATLLERNETVGGLCRSIQDKGFTFDYAGHIMFSADADVLALYKILLGDNVHWQVREAWVYTEGVYTRYPFQSSLYGLPADVIKECIVGAIEARYGENDSMKNMTLTCGENADPANKGASRQHHDCCADGAVPDFSSPDLAEEMPRKGSFEAFIYQTWGKGIARHFAIPYNKKLWTVPLSEMETSWLGGRVPLPDLEQIIEGALEQTTKPVGPNARFGYPLKGGFHALMTGFLPHIKGRVETGAEVKKIYVQQRIVVLSDGRHYHYENMISTMVLPELIRLMGEDAPSEIRQAAMGLRHVSVRCVNLGVARDDLTDKHWIYFAGKTVFHRIFVQGNASPFCSPPGCCGLTCEISYSPDKPLPADGQALIDRCIQECIDAGIFSASDKIITTNQIDIPYAYVIYDHQRKENVERIRTWLSQYGITLAGRYSEWEYYNSDHAFIAGKVAVEKVKQAARRHSVR